MDKGNFARLRHLIDTVDWEGDTKEMDIEQTWLYFKDHYDKAVDICIPQYTAKQSKWRRPLWMNGKAIKTSKRNTGLGKSTKTLEDRRTMTDTAEKGTRHSY